MPISDEEFIDRIRKQDRRRRWFGVVGVVLGVAVCAMCFYWLVRLDRQHRELVDLLDPQSPATTQQLDERSDQLQYRMGMALGFALATGMAGAASLAVNGFIYAFIKDRRTRLLLQLWDDRHTHPGDRRLDL
jgi:hypothetical protein